MPCKGMAKPPERAACEPCARAARHDPVPHVLCAGVEEGTLAAGDGHTIATYRWRTAGKPRGIVQIAHGMAEHAARYDETAKALSTAGWAVYAHDHRGHGKSVKDERDLGHFGDHDGFEKVLKDLRAVRAWARKEEAANLPLVLFGHSMGSFISLTDTFSAPGEIDGLVLSASNRGGGVLVHAGRIAATLECLRQGGRGKSALLASLSFGSFNKSFEPARTPFDWLSRDREQVDRYIADPKCGFPCTNQLWVDLLGGLIEMGKDENLRKIPRDLPIWILAGSRDPVSDGGKGLVSLIEQLKSVGLTRVTHTFYPEGRHELLNETNRSEVVGDLLRWLEPIGA
jgi:alpha-beta hydrolase superfamily lysophospholipase